MKVAQAGEVPGLPVTEQSKSPKQHLPVPGQVDGARPLGSKHAPTGMRREAPPVAYPEDCKVTLART